MSIMLKCYIAIILFFALVPEAESRQSKQDSTIFKALPLAYFTPETRIAAEGFAFYSFYAKESKRKSNLRMFVTYTQNKQYLLILPWQVYTSGDQYFLNGSIDYRKFPEYYYGLGNNTKETSRALYAFKALTFKSKSYKRLKKDTYIGLALQGQWLKPKFPEMELLFEDVLEENGREGYGYMGFGPAVMWDKRDHILSPSSGSFVEFSPLIGVGKSNHSAINFGLLSLDMRHYLALADNITWANQFLTQLSFGEVPFRTLPTLGGPFLHRGYYQGRFRDNHSAILQSEYRHHVIGRFGFVVFGSAGRVYKSLQEKLYKNIHLAAGGGLRVRISKKDRTNVRLDYSFTSDSRGFYIYFAEAF
ncbi:BamA/TamA family outer membrane protein [uncultured Cyclobacterium sp.]|uniref:BamA/TamA family outer membrane protein n=1 Tax=uncultured Cyclobacterium sp. TaxID=453820 RepID=UPI0030EBE48D